MKKIAKLLVLTLIILVFTTGCGKSLTLPISGAAQQESEAGEASTVIPAPTNVEKPNLGEEASEAWVVDTSYMEEMGNQARFTTKWDYISEASVGEKEVYLAGIKECFEDGSIIFNPRALAASLLAWQPALLEESGIKSWKDLTKGYEGQLAANQLATDLTEKFFEFIRSDDIHVLFAEMPENVTNSGSTKDGLFVISSTPEITGNRWGWIIRTTEQMEKASIEGRNIVDDPDILDMESNNAVGQLARCGNPVWATPPSNIPTGRTDEPDDSDKPTPTPKPDKPTPTPKPDKKPTTKPNPSKPEHGDSSGATKPDNNGGSGESATKPQVEKPVPTSAPKPNPQPTSKPKPQPTNPPVEDKTPPPVVEPDAPAQDNAASGQAPD